MKSSPRPSVKYDESKIDEVVLALLGAWEFESARAWKRIDFAVIERLYAAGYITNPRGKHESAYLSDAGLALAKELAKKHFGAG